MTKRDDIIQKLRDVLPEGALSRDEAYRSGVALAAQVPVEKLREAAGVCEATGFYLESITGLDFLDTAELVYHLNCYEPLSRIALRVLCAYEQPPPTLSDIFPSALWLEREVHDFFGIAFGNHPDLRPLLLPEDADYHPLRKTFGKVSAYRERKEIYGSG
jgi:NADH-quinone oxidoreductase subunit C